MTLALLAVFAALASAVAVYLGHYGTDILVVYLVSIVSLILALSGGRLRLRRPRLSRRAVVTAAPILFLVILQLALSRYFASFPEHFHQDAFVTAFISYQLPDLTQIQWFVGYPAKDDWVAQFPILFFVLQKPFFMVLGPTADAVLESVWPYLALTTIYLYLLAYELLPRRSFAFAAGLAAVLFAPSLYLSSLGVHFHSSTFFLIACSYHLLRLMRTDGRAHAVACGLFAACAYLTYPSSYVAVPLLLGFVALEALARRSTRPIRLFLPSLAMLAFVMLPFIVSSLSGSDFLTQRVGQINSLSGDSYGKPALAYGSKALSFLEQELEYNMKSLYEPGYVATVTGYLFGNQAFLSPLALCLFVLGNLCGLFRALFRGERGYVLVSATLVVAFVTGMALTLPSGGFHRVSIAYPFVGLTIALGAFLPVMALEWALPRIPRAWPIGQLATAALVVAFCVTSFSRATEMVEPDQMHDSPTVARYVEENLPAGETVGIAFARNYHLGRELFFRTGGRKFVTGSLDDILDHPTSSVFILAYATPPEVDEIKQKYPGVTFLATVDGVRLKDHYIVVTTASQAAAH
jgi:hypothetical protein